MEPGLGGFAIPGNRVPHVGPLDRVGRAVAGLMLWVPYLPQRRHRLCGHRIVAVRALCFTSLVPAAPLLPDSVPGHVAAWLLLLPAHPFLHGRGVNRSGIAVAPRRMALPDFPPAGWPRAPC